MESIKYNSDGTAVITEKMEKELAAVTNAARCATVELCDMAKLRAGSIFVVGCSTSEVCGNTIGKASVPTVAQAVLDGIYPVLRERGIYLAAQCCEHLNRAIIIERECAEKYGLDEVCVRPQPKAGGSFATMAYEAFEDAVAVERIKANAGIDIGGTLIGMHLREVAVPVRLSVSRIGSASIICARTRPKYVGGPRAVYE